MLKVEGKRFEARDVSVSMGGRDILNTCSFEIAAGEWVSLAGPNGAGKTTMLRAIAGLQRHSGSIILAGEEFQKLPPASRARAMAYLPQNGKIHWPMPVVSIVALGRLPFGRPWQEASAADKTAISEAMKRCDLEALANQPATSLSGGEQARVLLARAIATGADLLLADEPLAALDPAQQLAAMNVLREYVEDGRSVIAVSHDIGMAMRFNLRLVVIDSGVVVGDGPGEQLLEQGVLDAVFGVQFEGLYAKDKSFAGLAIR